MHNNTAKSIKPNNGAPLMIMTGSDEWKTLIERRAYALGFMAAGMTALLTIIIAIILGTTGTFTVNGAMLLGVAGGIVGGMVIGLLIGSAYYIVQMWNSSSWATKTTPN